MTTENSEELTPRQKALRARAAKRKKKDTKKDSEVGLTVEEWAKKEEAESAKAKDVPAPPDEDDDELDTARYEEVTEVEDEEEPEPASEPAPRRRSSNGEREEIRTAWGEVDEDDPEMREQMSFGEIEPAEGEKFPDLAGRGPPQNLTDVCALYPIGNGKHYIRLERVRPNAHMNIPTAGYLGEIRHAMSEAQFRHQFGGGVYKMIVYGPDPKGRTDPNSGMPIVKALTKQISFTVPGHPNLETMVSLEDSPMQQIWDPTRRRFPPTSAEASMHRDNIQATERMLDRKDREVRELRQELERKTTTPIEPVVGAVRETAQQTMQMLREDAARNADNFRESMRAKEAELAMLREKIDQLMNRPNESSTAWSAMRDVASALAPGRHGQEELGRLYENHREESRRMEESHRREMEGLRAAYDERIRALNEFQENERRRAREESKDVREQFERRERELNETWERRFKEREERFQRDQDSVRKEHEREVATIHRQNELVMLTEKKSLEARVEALKDRLEAAKEEAAKARSEADSKGDFAEQMIEFQSKAEALGYSKAEADAPRDWKERLAHAFGNALMNADKIVQAAANTLRERNLANEQALAARRMTAGATHAAPRLTGAVAPPPHVQAQEANRVIRGPGGRPVTAQRPIFATEGLNIQSPLPTDDAPPPSVQSRVQFPQPAAPPARSAPRHEAPQPEPQARGEEEALAEPSNGVPPPPVEIREVDGPPPIGLSGDDLEAFRLWAEAQIQTKQSPTVFAKEFVERVGAENAGKVMGLLRVEDLFDALSSTPQTLSSPILTREGMAWMRKAWSEVQKISGVSS